MRLEGTRCWVIGLARSGCAAGALLRRHGAAVLGLDDADTATLTARWEREELAATAAGCFDEVRDGGREPDAAWARPGLVVISPGVPGTHPFILTSYSDDLAGMSILAHELGHSMHSYLTWQHQPFLYADYSLFVAEVASNFNQALVRAHLMKANPDPEFQIALIEEAMNNFHRYFFIMPTLARFELEMHQRIEAGEGLTADAMNARMLELYQEGYGDELDPDGARTGITWATFGHLYANYYVFQYATGISAAHALAQHVLDGEPRAAERYLTMLKSGSSLYAMDALKLAGADMQTPEAVETTFAVLARYVDRLEELVAAREK